MARGDAVTWTWDWKARACSTTRLARSTSFGAFTVATVATSSLGALITGEAFWMTAGLRTWGATAMGAGA